MSLKVWKKNSRKEKQKKSKKTKRKNLTPSSTKTIFHTLITLKDIFLAHHVNHSKNCSKTKLSSTSKKIKKKPKYQKKWKAFLFCGPIQNLNLYTEIFLTFTHWWSSNVRLINLQLFFLFWKISQSILLRVSHPKKKFPLVHF